MKETGCKLENPAASTFRESILDGDWDKVDYIIELFGKDFLCALAVP